ncbi:MAG: DNA polymerase III subunit gamma/tau [Candidatus Aminicenantes bacterium]|nr:DNA polymerase III subunit gamma/tau [Candidatus Aminicenantes bacterium]
MAENQRALNEVHLVLARKYRPQTFEEVVGQKTIIETLRNAIKSGRLAQAYIFSGMRGVGKTTVARILAKALNCRLGPTPNPCNVCEFCQAIKDDREVDVLEIDGASYRVVDEISSIRDAARLGPIHSRYKVIIIDEVHMLSKHAFNALLKTLEEPSPRTIFIFATTEFHKVPLTIVSRCQHFEFKRIPQKEIADHLIQIAEKEKVSLTKLGAQLIAEMADGSLRDAESLLDKAMAFCGTEISDEKLKEILGLVPREVLFEASSLIFAGRADLVFPFINKIIYQGYDLKLFYEELVRHFRNLLLVSTIENPEEILLLTSEEVSSLKNEAKKVSSIDLIRTLQILLQAEAGLKYTVNPQIYLETLLVRLCHISHLVPLKEIIRSLEEGKLKENLEPLNLTSREDRMPLNQDELTQPEKVYEIKGKIAPSDSIKISLNGQDLKEGEIFSAKKEIENKLLMKEVSNNMEQPSIRKEIRAEEKEALLANPAIKSFIDFFKGRVISIDPLPRQQSKDEV